MSSNPNSKDRNEKDQIKDLKDIRDNIDKQLREAKHALKETQLDEETERKELITSLEELHHKIEEQRDQLKSVNEQIKSQQDTLTKLNEKEKEKKILQKSDEPIQMEKLKRILQVSDKVELNRIQSALKMDDEVFNEKIFEWANDFRCTIDGIFLVVNKETVEDFVAMLDDSFKYWDNKEKN